MVNATREGKGAAAVGCYVSLISRLFSDESRIRKGRLPDN